MAHAKIPGQIYVARHGEHTARPSDTAGTDNNRSVVERRFVPEDVFQKLRVHRAVQGGTGLDGVIQHILPLKDHQRTGLAPGQGRIGLYRLRDGAVQFVALFPLGKDLSQTAAPHLFQKAADLRLEQDNQGQNAPFHHLAQQKVDRIQAQEAGDPKSRHQQQDALGHPAGTGAADQQDDLIDHKGHDEHIDDVGDADGPYHAFDIIKEFYDRVHFPRPPVPIRLTPTAPLSLI